MPATAVDTSVVIPAVVGWHVRHVPAAAAIERLLRRKSLLLPLPVVLESYSVLTRLPAPHRLSPTDAYELLVRTFRDTRLSPFRPRNVWLFLQSLAERAIAGGTAYDAAVLEAARAGGAATLLTYNRADFERLELQSIKIVEPV
jgi:predicted nucleic acid-binding protein